MSKKLIIFNFMDLLYSDKNTVKYFYLAGIFIWHLYSFKISYTVSNEWTHKHSVLVTVSSKTNL